MTRRTAAIDPKWFIDLYAEDADPWQFATSPYEQAKYRATLDALSRERYESAFEIGCANGVFTRQLAPRTSRLLAVDVVPQVLEAARQNCAGLPNIEFRLLQLPDRFPEQQFDLITLCEVGYYWDRPGVERFARWATDALLPAGDLVMVHWTGETDYPLTADEVHEIIIQQAGARFRLRGSRRTETYRLDMVSRSPGG